MECIEAEIDIAGSVSVLFDSEAYLYLWNLYQTSGSDKRFLLMFGLSENWSAKVVDFVTTYNGHDMVYTFYIRGVRDGI